MPYIINSKFTVPINTNYEKPIPDKYLMNDLSSVYSHWSPKLHKNVVTENKLKGDVINGKSSK